MAITLDALGREGWEGAVIRVTNVAKASLEPGGSDSSVLVIFFR